MLDLYLGLYPDEIDLYTEQLIYNIVVYTEKDHDPFQVVPVKVRELFELFLRGKVNPTYLLNVLKKTLFYACVHGHTATVLAIMACRQGFNEIDAEELDKQLHRCLHIAIMKRQHAVIIAMTREGINPQKMINGKNGCMMAHRLPLLDGRERVLEILNCA